MSELTRCGAEHEARLAEALDAYLAAVRAGEAPDREGWLARHPDLADDLRECLASLEFIRLAGVRPGSEPPGEPPAGAEPSGGTLGDFRLLREVGRGGMGVVYEAEQISLGRRVALKVLPFAATMDPRQLQRFHNEARAAASLHHEHIVPVYAVGSERGVHFYAMQFIDGLTLAEFIARQRQPTPTDAGGATPAGEATTPYTPSPGDPQARTADGPVATTQPAPRGQGYYRRVADWGTQAAEALEHAHALGVVHRDVKPANLMLDAQGTLWVTDFGVARTAADSGLTVSGDLVGTLRYMSPEQALGQRGVVDHRTDIYSLGVTLYELLTLEPAFGGADRAEVLRRIGFEEPRPPRKLDRAIPAELETIVLKAMEKAPEARYATAQELADDLRRWLEDRPIVARKPTLAQRGRKWARRHRGLVWAAGLGLVALLATSLVSTLLVARAYTAEAEQRVKAQRQERLARRAEEQEAGQRRVAEGERDNALWNLYVSDMQRARQAWEDADLGRVEELLEGHRPAPGQRDRRGWEWFYLRGLCEPAGVTIREGGPEVTALAWSPDGRRLATAGAEDKSIKLWDAVTGQRVSTLRGHTRYRVYFVAWSPDGKRLASLDPGDGIVRVWDPLTARVQRSFTPRGPLSGGAYGLAWSPDGRRLLAASDQTLQVWDVRNGARSFPARGRLPHTGEFLADEFRPFSVAWSPDGKRLALGANGWGVKTEDHSLLAVWDPSGAEKPLVLRAHRGSSTESVSWDPEGKRVASAGGAEVKVWDAATGKELLRLPGVRRVAWSPDGKLLAAPSASESRAVKVWDANSGREVRTLRGHRDRAFLVAWAPDSRRLASSDFGSVVKVWDLAAPREYTPLASAAGNPSGPALVDWHDRGGLAVANLGGVVRIWDPAKRREVCRLDAPAPPGAPRGFGHEYSAVAWSRDGRSLAVATTPVARDQITVWDVPTRRVVRVLRDVRREATMVNAVSSLAWSPGGQHLASVHPDQTVKVWDMAAGRAVRTFPGNGDIPLRLAWSRDGGRLAAAGFRGTIRLWETGTWRELAPWPGHAGEVKALAWSPDGRWLASAGEDRTVRLWDRADPRTPRVLRGHTEAVQAVAWSSDGRRLASAGADGTLRVWAPATGEELLALREPASAVVWGPGDRSLVSAGREGVKVWDATSGYRAAPPPAKEAAPAQRLEEALIRLNLGSTLLESGRLAPAETSLRRALDALQRLADDYPEASSYRQRLGGGHHLLGVALAASGRPAEAVEQFRRALVVGEDLVRRDPTSHGYRKQAEEAHIYLARALNAAGRSGEAAEEYLRLAKRPPQSWQAQNEAAWFLATCPDRKRRDPALAVQLATRAANLMTTGRTKAQWGAAWNTLGVARYRAGDWKGTIAALRRSMELRKGGDSADWFFLAMAHWRLGEKDKARSWYDKAVAWMDKNQPKDEELRRFRAEAAQLLGVSGPPPGKGTGPRSGNGS